jgi:hypothetical protein
MQDQELGIGQCGSGTTAGIKRASRTGGHMALQIRINHVASLAAQIKCDSMELPAVLFRKFGFYVP